MQENEVTEKDHEPDKYETFLIACSLDPTPDNVEQLTVFMIAMDIYEEREQRYRGLWKRYGWLDTLLHIRSKTARVMQEWWGESAQERDLDNAYDLLNYAAFFIRNVRAGNKFGDL